MNLKAALLLITGLGACTVSLADPVHWTAKVDFVTSRSDGRAQVQVSAPTNPNPSGSTWNCDAGVVKLGSATEPAQAGMLSVAMAAQATGTDVRFDVDGCVASYITMGDR